MYAILIILNIVQRGFENYENIHSTCPGEQNCESCHWTMSECTHEHIVMLTSI